MTGASKCWASALVEVLGEAVKRLPDALRERHPQLPWKKIAGTRDYIAHGYDSVDYDVIWGVLNIEAGKLKEFVLTILAKEFPETSDTTISPKMPPTTSGN